uniref:Uncharacterized protein n=1 Tax=Anguilla anguilla TaxID=7936 RepID=A0A0E9VJ46_ANGAN
MKSLEACCNKEGSPIHAIGDGKRGFAVLYG